MKRSAFIGVVAAALGAATLGVAVGPDLWTAQRFETSVAQDEASRGGDWPQVQDACALCHGPGGRSKNAHYPALAGLSAPYIEAQLHAFADGSRKSPQMGPLANQLSEADISRLAAWFASQKPEQTEAPAGEFAGQGKSVVLAKGCASCHGGNLMGTPVAPRLAGQGEIYLASQLTAFKAGARADPTGAMNGTAVTLSDQDISAAARYLAGQKPEAGSIGK